MKIVEPLTSPARESYLITLVGKTIPAELLGAVLHRLSTTGALVDALRTVEGYPYVVLELTVRIIGPSARVLAALRVQLREITRHSGADVLVRTSGTCRLVVFDVDSTLVRGEVIDQLAEAAGRGAEVRRITERAMRGELDFTESLRHRVSVLAGLPSRVLDETALELTPGAQTAVRTLHEHGVRTGVVSGGFRPIVARLAASLGISFVEANDLEVENGILTGRVVGPVVDRAAKADALRRFAAANDIPLSQCAAVGDGANDIDMLRTAGTGIAFNAKPAVQDAADVVVSFPRLDLVLAALGLPSVPAANRWPQAA